MGVGRGASLLWEGWGGPQGWERDTGCVGIPLESGEAPGCGRWGQWWGPWGCRWDAAVGPSPSPRSCGVGGNKHKTTGSAAVTWWHQGSPSITQSLGTPNTQEHPMICSTPCTQQPTGTPSPRDHPWMLHTQRTPSSQGFVETPGTPSSRGHQWTPSSTQGTTPASRAPEHPREPLILISSKGYPKPPSLPSAKGHLGTPAPLSSKGNPGTPQDPSNT